MCEDDPDIVAKKLRSMIDLMQRPSRNIQKSFTWDDVGVEQAPTEEKKPR